MEYAKGCDYSGRSTGILPATKFEWYLKNHLGSTMLVYGTSAYSDPLNSGYKGGVKAAYDYRAFGEQVDLTVPAEKVTENFTGKEKDDETELNYFGARYLDPMIGMWTSVDAKRQYQNPYLYAGNNPIMRIDPDGNQDGLQDYIRSMVWNNTVIPQFEKAADISAKTVAAGAIAGTAVLAVAGDAAIAVAAPEAIAAVASNPAVQRMCVQHCGKIVGATEFLSGAISGPGPSQGKEAVGAVVRGIYDAATENQVPVDEKLLFNDGVAPSDKTGVTIPFDYEEGLNE